VQKFHLNIADNDRDRKIKDIIKWLQSKKQVRVQIDLRGRERGKPELGIEMLEKIHEQISEYGTRAKAPTNENLSMMYNPKK